jgi:biotin operon repressor
MKHMNQKAAICEYLRQNHEGVEKAVCSRELERLFSLDGRSLRRKINSLRQDGYPICSGVTGYFYAANQQEINGTVCRLNELILKISNARTGLLYSSVQPCNEVTLEVNIHLTEGR